MKKKKMQVSEQTRRRLEAEAKTAVPTRHRHEPTGRLVQIVSSRGGGKRSALQEAIREAKERGDVVIYKGREV